MNLELNFMFKTWEMIGLEKLKPYLETSAVIMVNHQTTLDILGLFELWPYVGKVFLMKKGFV